MRILFAPLSLSLVPAVCSLVAAGPAAAQQLEEVVVVARKRAQPEQSVGIGITTFSAAEMRSLNFRTSDQVASQAPGVQATSFSGDPTVMLFAIRGVGQNDFVDHHEGPTAVYVDGAYVSALGALGFQSFDLDHVEVLRGPQGTLFGRNATGGLIHYISAKPARDFEGYVNLRAGEYDEFGLEAVVNGPLGESVAGRLSIATSSNDGYVVNRIGEDVRETDAFGIRAQLDFDISQDLDVLVKLHAERDDDARVGAFDQRAAIPGVDGLGEYLADDVNADWFGLGSCEGCDPLGYKDTDGDIRAGDFDSSGLFNRDTEGATVTLTLDRAGLTFTSVTDILDIEKSYGEDSDGSPNALLAWSSAQEAKQFSQEVRLAGEADRVNWTAGAYLLDIDGDYSNVLASPDFLATQFNTYSLQTTSWALFGEIDYALSDQLALVAGLRYTDDQKDFSLVPSCVGAGCVGFFVFPGLGAIGDIGGFTEATVGSLTHMDDDDVAAKLQLEWRPHADLLVFGGVTRGNKAGGFNAPLDGLLFPEEMRYRPEVLTSYEAGFKSTFAGGRIRLNGNVFHYDYDDKQAFTFSGLTTLLINRQSDIDGMELELVARPADELDVRFGLSLLDATVDDLPLPSGRSARQEMAQAPDVTLNGQIRKGWRAARGMVHASVDVSYVGEQYFNTINHPTVRADSYTMWNGRLEYAPEQGKWDAALFVRNLSDEDAIVYAIDVSAFGYALRVYSPPRWVGAEFRVRW